MSNSTSYNWLAKSINQIIWYFLTNCFTFLQNFECSKWENHVSGISLIFFQCCFISETQLLMTVSNFGVFSPRNHGRGGGGAPWGASALIGGFGKKLWNRRQTPPSPCLPHHGKPCIRMLFLLIQHWNKLKNVSFHDY